MALVAGSCLGPYEITGPLGAGGMGEVYKARDTRLERAVAVKVLPPHLSASPEARQRLEREAKTISKLSHPHICALYDVGHQDGTDFLVMELLDGETLAERLTKGPLSFAQTMRYGVEIADALDTAHRQGIVHRDLKPGNVMLTKSGVKLLDFGLAKAIAPLFPGSDSSELATVTAPLDLTQEGSVPGTLQYMAPEQIEGRTADSRSDIFAFGVVLYEMATGKRAFTGKSRAALAAAIVGDEPAAISSIRPASPLELDRIVRSCLAKDPERRWQTAHDIGLQLAALGESVPQAASALPARRNFGRWIPWAAFVTAAAVAIGALLRPGAPAHNPAPVRFSVPPPPGGAFYYTRETLSMALSPDGSQLAFVASDPTGGTRVWLRPLSALDTRPVAGTEGATSLFWSPDGRSIAFFANGKLRRLDLPGGAAVPLCDVREGLGLFGSWGRDGQILFASVEGEAIFRVSTSGGEPIEEIKPDRSHGRIRVVWPWFLPDGNRFLYLSRGEDLQSELVLSDPGKPPRSIMPVSSNVQWVDPDYLVFAREGTLVGQHVDLSSGRVTGEPFSIADPVRYFLGTASTTFTTSRNGVLVYQAHTDVARVVWVDLSGREIAQLGTSANYGMVRISPDGRKAVVERGELRGGAPDVWEFDLDRGVETRLTSDPRSDFGGAWLPDGGAVVFSAARGGPPHLFRKELATGAEKELLPVGRFQLAEDVSPDGRTLAFIERTGHGNFDAWTLPLSGEPTPSPLLSSPFNEQGVVFSPDGRFIAFESDESGRPEVYVAPFPATGGRTRVSTGGARLPHWSRDGRELFYLSDDRRLFAVPVRTVPALRLGSPSPLFSLKGSATWIDFDVSLDGKKFLVIVPEFIANEQPLTVVTNWTAEIGH